MLAASGQVKVVAFIFLCFFLLPFWPGGSLAGPSREDPRGLVGAREGLFGGKIGASGRFVNPLAS